MCIESRALSAAVVLMMVTVAGAARGQAQGSEPSRRLKRIRARARQQDRRAAASGRAASARAAEEEAAARGARRRRLRRTNGRERRIRHRALRWRRVASGSFQGGILLGLGMRGFVFGLCHGRLAGDDHPCPGDPECPRQLGRSTRVGIAARVPMARTSDGRVSLFAAGDLAIASLYTVVNATSSPHAEGITWSLGPGLRFWLNDHLSLAYLTRVRWTRLEGAPAALPEVPDDWLAPTVSARYTQLEGVFQFLCIF